MTAPHENWGITNNSLAQSKEQVLKSEKSLVRPSDYRNRLASSARTILLTILGTAKLINHALDSLF